MDYRQTYEILLKTICENDKRILQLLAHISQCDDMLLELSLQTCPNPVTLQAITLKKDRLIEQLENASADEEQYCFFVQRGHFPSTVSENGSSSCCDQ